MKKIFSLFVIALFSVSMWADNTYLIKGIMQTSEWDNEWKNMSVSTNDGFYEYYLVTNKTSKFLIKTTSSDTEMGLDCKRAGYNGTNILNTWKDGESNNACFYDENDYYILIYYPNTTVNPGTSPIICASSTLPTNPKYYITGNAALVGESSAWNGKAIEANSDTYTFTNLAAGEYKLVVLPTGNWDEFDRKYTALTYKSDAGLTGDNDDNICFRLTEPADVTVTYIKTSESSVFTVTTTGDFFSLEEGYYLLGTFSGVDKWLVTDLTADKKFTLNQYLGNNKDEYKLNITVAEGDRFKAAYVYKNSISSLVPAEGDDYVIQAAQAGNVIIYFRYDYSGTTWGCNFYVVQDKGTALDNTADEAKAVKRIVNGQLVIEREGKLFNALGAEIK